MSARYDYFHDLKLDAEDVTQDTQLQAAIIIADGLNGVRKALLDLTEATRQMRKDPPTATSSGK